MAVNWLAEVTGYNLSTGTEEILRLSKLKFTTFPGDTPANTRYIPRLTGSPPFTIKTSLYSGSRITQESELDFGDLRVANLDGFFDAYEDSHTFDGRAVRILRGIDDDDYADYEVVFEGTCSEGFAESGEFVWPLRGKEVRLDSPVSLNSRAGVPWGLELDGSTSYVELPVEAGVSAFEDFTVGMHFNLPHGKQGTSTVLQNGTLLAMGNSAAYADRFAIAAAQFSYQGVAVHWDGHVISDARALWDRKNHSLIFSKRGFDYYLLIDGEVWAEGTIPSTFARSIAAAYVRLGAGLDGAAGRDFGAGTIFGVSLWNRSFDQDLAVGTILGAPIDRSAEGLLALYRLDEGIDVSLGLTSDPLAASDPWSGSVAHSHVWDSANTPAGVGWGSIQGAGHSWKATYEGDGDDAGEREQFLLGDVFTVEPDLVEPAGQLYSFAGHPIAAVEEVSVAGVPLREASRLSLNGTSDEINSANSSAHAWGVADEFCIEWWGTLRATSGTLFYTVNGSMVIRGRLVSGTLTLEVTSSGGQSVTLTSDQKLRIDEAYHISANVTAAGPLALFVNGRRATTAVHGTTPTGNLTTASGWDIGHAAGADFLACELEGFRITDHFLSEAQVVSRQFRELKVADEADMLTQYAVDENTGSTLTDTGSDGTNATITGGTWIAGDYTLDERRANIAFTAAPVGEIRANVKGWMPLGHGVGPAPDATDGHVDCGTGSDLDMQGDFVVDFWFRYDNAADAENPFYVRKHVSSTTPGSWYVRGLLSGDRTQFYVRTDTAGYSVNADVAIDDGREHHCRAVYCESQGWMGIWIDGVEQDREDGIQGTLFGTSHADPFLIAGNATGQYLLGGMVQRVALIDGYDDTVREHLDLYRFRRPPGVASGVRYAGLWHCDENEGSTVYDYSGNENHGTLNGGAAFVRGVYPQTRADAIRWLAEWGDIEKAFSGDEVDDEALEELAIDDTANVSFAGREETRRQALNALMFPNAWYGVGRDGRLEAGRLRMPDVHELHWLDGENGYGTLSHFADYGYVGARGMIIDIHVKWGGAPRNPGTGTLRSWIFEKLGELAMYYDYGNGRLYAIAEGTTYAQNAHYWPGVDFSDGEWHWIRWNVGRRLLWIDGVAYSGAINVAHSWTPATTNDVYLGRQTTAEDWWRGFLADFAVFKIGNPGARYAEQIIARHLADGASTVHLPKAQFEGDEQWLVSYAPLVDDPLVQGVYQITQVADDVGVSTTPLGGTWTATTPEQGYLHLSRRGKYRVTNSRRAELSLSRRGTRPPVKEARLRYARSVAPLRRSDASGLILSNPKRLFRVTGPGPVERFPVPGLATKHRLAAEGETIVTGVSDQPSAERGAQLYGLNHGRRRRVWSAEVLASELEGDTIERGDEVRVVSSRFGFDAPGRNLLVLEADRKGDRVLLTGVR